MKKEYQIQKNCVAWFRSTYPDYVLFSVPNEATHSKSNYYKSIGALPGASDIIIVLPEKVLFIEFKAPKGKQSTQQKEFQTKIEALCQEYYLCFSEEEFQAIVNKSVNNSYQENN
jgi:hypothetical protein